MPLTPRQLHQDFCGKREQVTHPQARERAQAAHPGGDGCAPRALPCALPCALPWALLWALAPLLLAPNAGAQGSPRSSDARPQPAQQSAAVRPDAQETTVGGEHPPAGAQEASKEDDSSPPSPSELTTKTPALDQEVLVAGQRRFPTQAAQAPHVASWSRRRTDFQAAGLDTADVLRTSPGVQVSEHGGLGAPATVNVRGASAAQTPVYFGGVRLNDEVGGVANLSDVPLTLVDRVDVYRSHAPPQLSTLGMGGAILLSPRNFHQPSARLELLGGSFGTVGLTAMAGTGGTKQSFSFGFSARGSKNDYPFPSSEGTLFDPDDDRTRTLTNADAADQAGWFFSTHDLGRATATILLSHGNRDQGAPKLALVPTQAARAHFQKTLVALHVTADVPVVHGNIQAATTASFGETVLDDPELELSLVSTQTRTPGQRVEQMFQLTEGSGGPIEVGQQLIFSTERLLRLEAQGTGPESEALAAHRWTTRAALFAKTPEDKAFSGSALLALRCFDTSVTTLGACGQVAPAAQLSVGYQNGGLSLGASAAHAHRVPTLSELYGTSLVVRGNPNLTVEEGDSLELILRYQVQKKNAAPLLWLEVSPFVRFSRDLIIFVKTAQGYLVPRNRDNARTLGAELSAGLAPSELLALETNLSLLDPRDTSAERVTENDVLPFFSRATWTLRGIVRAPFALGPLPPSLTSELTYQSSRYADPAGLGVIPEQLWWDLSLQLPLGAASSPQPFVTVQARVANVLGTPRYDLIGYPLPGRSFFAEMDVTW